MRLGVPFDLITQQSSTPLLPLLLFFSFFFPSVVSSFLYNFIPKQENKMSQCLQRAFIPRNFLLQLDDHVTWRENGCRWLPDTQYQHRVIHDRNIIFKQ